MPAWLPVVPFGRGPSDVGEDRLAHLSRRDEIGDLLFLGGADLPEQDDGLGLRIGLEEFHHPGQGQADYPVPADVDDGALADASPAQAGAERRGHAAAPGGDAHRPRAEPLLRQPGAAPDHPQEGLPRAHDPERVGADHPGAEPIRSLQDLQRVVDRHPVGDEDHQPDAGLQGLQGRIPHLGG
ncbi:MAG: hypothetical protein HYW08_13890, partial [candidate division NC10 bacterium]|nr:hypothetical protein [candidate division NC10 bacterium]